MTKLSICIPVEPNNPPPVYVARELLADPSADIEIIVAPYDTSCDDAVDLYALAAEDSRLRILPAAPLGISAASLWIGTVRAASGDWITVIRPNDMLDVDLPGFLEHVETTMPDVDAYGWNSFQIDAAAPRHIQATVAVPIQHHTMDLDKTTMLEAFFQWKDSSNAPKMPLGIYHAAIRRSLLEAVLSSSGPLSWLTPVPEHEWAARVLLFSNGLAFSSRPLSAMDVRPFATVAVPTVLEGFPFNAGIGLTAAIAEIQCRVLHELGAEWGGFNEDFLRACMLDCMFEHEEAAFEDKAQAYYAALHKAQGGRLAAGFQPPYLPEPQADMRRGLHGRLLLVNRFLANAQTAQEFYRVARSLLAPVAIVRERPGDLIVGEKVPTMALSA